MHWYNDLAGGRVDVPDHVVLPKSLTGVESPIIVVFGVHTVVWGVVVTTIRQREVPSSMFGRVTAVYSLVDVGGAALGSLLGGAVAQAYGIVATFWTAAAAMAVVAIAAWRPLGFPARAFAWGRCSAAEPQNPGTTRSKRSRGCTLPK